MRKTWIHPEYRSVLQANVAGYMPVSLALSSIKNDLATSLAHPIEEKRSLFMRLFSCVMSIACFATILAAEWAFSSPGKVVLASDVFSADFGETWISSSNGISDKTRFLARMAQIKRGHIATNTHYIAEVIKDTGKALGEQNTELASAIVQESLNAGFDPLLVAAVIKSESTFNHQAVSKRGAQGLMQILPETGRYISQKNAVDWSGGHRLKEPQYNIRLGVAYLDYLRKNYHGNLEHALIAYNWGPGKLNAALKNKSKIPGCSVTYAQKILSTHEQWRKDLDTRMAAYKHMDISSMFS